MAKRDKSAAETVYIALRNDIISGKLAGGSPLVEDELAATYSVSRTPIREAMKKLESDGIVNSYPFRGSFVKRFTDKDLVDIFMVRKAIEGIGARIVTGVITDENIRTLKMNNQKSREAFEENNIELAETLGDHFHDAIITLCDNSYLQNIYDRMGAQLQYYSNISSRLEGRMERSLNEHDEILNALEERNADLTEEKMRNHIDSTMEDVLKAFRNARLKL